MRSNVLFMKMQPTLLNDFDICYMQRLKAPIEWPALKA